MDNVITLITAFIIQYIFCYLLPGLFLFGESLGSLLRSAGWFVFILMLTFLTILNCVWWFRFMVSAEFGLAFWFLQYILDRQKVIDFKREKRNKRGQ